MVEKLKEQMLKQEEVQEFYSTTLAGLTEWHPVLLPTITTVEPKSALIEYFIGAFYKPIKQELSICFKRLKWLILLCKRNITERACFVLNGLDWYFIISLCWCWSCWRHYHYRCVWHYQPCEKGIQGFHKCSAFSHFVWRGIFFKFDVKSILYSSMTKAHFKG